MKQFYIDLYNWVETINEQAKAADEEAYWDYIVQSAGHLSQRYNDSPLAIAVISAHLDYLQEVAKSKGGA